MQTHGIVESEAPGPISKPANLAPAGTTDTHFHIFGPTDRYPLSPKRLYNPCLSDVPAYLEMASTVGIERMVIVQASIYGTDNSCLLDSIAEFGQHRARGIAVVDASVTHAQLADMHTRGVRGNHRRDPTRVATEHCRDDCPTRVAHSVMDQSR